MSLPKTTKQKYFGAVTGPEKVKKSIYTYVANEIQ